MSITERNVLNPKRWIATEESLADPLQWRKPWYASVGCSKDDLFGQRVPFDFIDRVFAVMALCPQHTFQVLTKRPERAAEYLNSQNREHGYGIEEDTAEMVSIRCADLNEALKRRGRLGQLMPWPLPNVHLGCSVEDQPTADERIPHLLRCPAAVRFLSCEPLLGPVDLSRAMVDKVGLCGHGTYVHPLRIIPGRYVAGELGPIHWVISGGESGPRARPCNVEWIRFLVQQCREASVPVFIKQLGAKVAGMPCPECGGTCEVCVDQFRMKACPVCDGVDELRLRDRKGGDPSEWPEDLRVREFPPQPQPTEAGVKHE